MAKAQKNKATETEVTTTSAALDTTAQAQSALDALVKENPMMSTSAKIRALSAQGFDKGPIAKVLGKRYQHVRNVLITPLKRPVE